jgi:hypothetical protein
MDETLKAKLMEAIVKKNKDQQSAVRGSDMKDLLDPASAVRGSEMNPTMLGDALGEIKQTVLNNRNKAMDQSSVVRGSDLKRLLDPDSAVRGSDMKDLLGSLGNQNKLIDPSSVARENKLEEEMMLKLKALLGK